MKLWIWIILFAATSACSRYTPLKPEDILSVHPVFKDTSFTYHRGYLLKNGVRVGWDKQNSYVKQYLAAHLDSLSAIKQDPDTQRIFRIIQSAKPFKSLPLPVKALPFSEFGYLKTTTGKVIRYGIGVDCLEDLDSHYIYCN